MFIVNRWITIEKFLDDQTKNKFHYTACRDFRFTSLVIDASKLLGDGSADISQ